MFDLDKLKAFSAVYRSGSVLVASRELHLTSAAVSFSIKALEREISTSLFTRVGKKFVPTPFGEKLQGIAMRLFADLDQLLGDMSLGEHEPSGKIRLGVTPGFGATVLVHIAAEYQKRYAKVNLVIRTATASGLARLLSEGEIAFAIVSDGGRLKDFPHVVATELGYSYDLGLYCSRSFSERWLGGKPTYKKLVALNHIGLHDAPTRMAEWYRHNFNITPQLKVGLTSDSIFAVLAAVHLHQGLAVLPSDVVKRDRDSRLLVEVGHPLTQPSFRYRLLRLKNRSETVSEKSFMQYLVASRAT